MLFKANILLMLAAVLVVTGCFDNKGGAPQSDITSPSVEPTEPAPVRVGNLEKLEVSPVPGVALNPQMGWLQLATKGTDTVVQTNSLMQKTGSGNSGNGNGNSGNSGNSGNGNSGNNGNSGGNNSGNGNNGNGNSGNSGNGNAGNGNSGNDDGNDNSGPGKDEDNFEVSAINVLVKEVSVRNANTEEWTLVSNQARAINLLNLNNDAKEFFANSPLTPGSYDEIRIKIDKNATAIVDTKVVPLEVPSGATSGIKMKGLFSIEKGYLTKINFIVDGKKSVIRQNKNKYSLRPVIRIDGVAEDLFPPLLAIVTPASQITKIVSHSIAIEYSDDFLNLSSLSILIDGVEAKGGFQITDSSATAQKTFSEGTHTIQAKISDKPGYTTVTEPVTLVVDLSAPVITFGHQSGVELPTASFTLNIKINDLTAVESKISLNGAEVQTFNLKEFQVPLTLVPGTNNIKVESTDQVGNSATTMTVVVFDKTPPVLTQILPDSQIKYYTNAWPISIPYKVTSNEALSSAKVNNVASNLANDLVSFSGVLSISSGGVQNFSAKAKDIAGNEATLDSSYEVIYDNVAPAISITNNGPSITNQPFVPVSVLIADPSPTWSRVNVNEIEIFQTSSKTFSLPFELMFEGKNSIKITSRDFAGNEAVSNIVEVVKDTVAPQLSELSPSNGKKLFQMQFSVTGKSNEKLSEAQVNGLSLTLSEDKKSFSGLYVAAAQGDQSLVWRVKDLAGNFAESVSNINIENRLLIPELVSIEPSVDSLHLLIVGSMGATRPGARVKISEGVFSFNRGETISSSDGSFSIQLEPFTSATLDVFDDSTNEHSSMQLNRSSQTTISGMVKDTDGNPLPGATIQIVGVNSSVVTDATGVFRIVTSVIGDQAISIDGGTIPQSVTGPTRKFAKTKIALSIGLRQQNTLERPVYLTPLFLDGSQTLVNQNTSTTVTSSSANGVTLTIPPNIAVFPNGDKSGSISMTVIDSDKTTIEVPLGAVPTKVVSLEPSGLTFRERVPLILPNDNDLPPGVEMIILSMNSATGRWEIDGLAKVSDNGLSVETKPGHGISHFSPVYAIPIQPLLTAMGDSKLAGIDASVGALATSVKLPSYKSLGTETAPQLYYKSAWASPTAFVTNIVDIPRTEVNFSEQLYEDGIYKLTYKRCYLICFPYVGLFYQTISRKTDYVSWWEPESIKSQLFVGSVASDKVEFINSSPNTPNGQDLPGLNFSQGFSSGVATYQGIPNQSRISYAVPLQNPTTNEFLPAGIYPTLSRFQIKLRNLSLTTVTQTNSIPKRGESNTNSQSFAQSRSLSDALPSDISTSIMVQNKVNSPAGRGWHIAGPQRIVNPSNNRLLIEESNGEFATYAVANTIETLFNGNPTSVDIDLGVALNQWPYAYAQMTDVSKTASLVKINLSSSNSVPTVVAPLVQYSGTIGNEATYNCPANNYSSNFTPSRHAYKVVPRLGGLAVGVDGSIYGSDMSQHLLFKSSSQSSVKIAGMSGGIEGVFGVAPPGFSFTPSDLNTWCKNNLGSECGSAQFQASESCERVRPQFCLPGTFCKVLDIPSFIESTGEMGFGYFAGDNINDLLGEYPQGIAVNNPHALSFSRDGRLALADTGNNLVRILNLNSKSISTVAGNASNIDSGDGGVAANAGIFHPRGVVFDKDGNLYISTESGYIRKVDTSGKISTIAGLPIDRGGVLADEAPANKIALNKPFGMVVDDLNQFLYVADTGSHRVFRIDLQNKVASSIAGSGQCFEGAIGDSGPALSASLCSPTYVGLDDNNNLLVVDSGHKRIRRVAFNSSTLGSISYTPTKKDLSILVRDQDGNWIRKFRNGSKIIFNSSGLAIQTSDSAGHISEYEYDSGNRLVSFKDPVGLKTEYSYSGSYLSSIQDPAGRITTFDFDSGFLKEIIFPDGSKRKFAYNAAGLLVKETNENGNFRSYSYNQWGRVESVSDYDNNVTVINDSTSASMSNNFTGGNVGQISGPGFENGKVKDKIVDANSNTVELTRDHNGLVNTIKDAEGKITLVDRDLEGNPLKITHPDQSFVEFIYDVATGDLVSLHDSKNNLTKTFQYDSSGNLLKLSDSLGNQVNRVYDAFGRLVQISDLNQGKVNLAYNSLGLVQSKSIRASSGVVLTDTIEYDSYGRTQKVTSAGGKYAEKAYDVAGNVIKTKSFIDSQRVSETKYEYDLLNRLTKVVSPKNESTNYTYYPGGELSQVVDSKGRTAKYEYSKSGKITKKIDTDGSIYNFSYDSNGNLKTQSDPKGNTRSFFYDQLNRISKIEFPDDVVNYGYNEEGLVSYVKNNVSLVEYQYAEDQIISGVQVSGIGAMSNYPIVPLSYSYNALGKRTAISSANGTIAYTYDSGMNLSGIQNSNGENFSLNYDSANRLTQIIRPGSRSSYVYTDNALLQSITHISNNTTASLAEYQYDQRNYPTSLRNVEGTTNFNYDLNGQLTSVDNASNSESYSYDDVGNRITDGSNALVYDQYAEKLMEDYSYFYNYDLNGNITQKIPKDQSKQAFKYSYSSKNQLVGVDVLASPLGQIVKRVTFTYDVLGRRMQKTVWDQTAQLDVKKSYIRNYINDGENVIFEYDGLGNVLAKYVHSGMTDDVLAVSITNSGVAAGLGLSAGEYYFLKDANGTITDVSDRNGNIIQRYNYSSFGKIHKIVSGTGQDISSAPVLKTNFAFTGREYDEETGLYFYRARFYDPSIGRFIQKDPNPGYIENPISLNKYAYANNNPMVFRDPKGESPWDDARRFIEDAVVAVAVTALIVWSGGGAISLAQAWVTIGSVAGGALAASAAMAAFQGGNFWDNVGNNFHTNFRIGAALIALSAIGAKIWGGGLAQAGGNGLQGFVVANKGYGPFQGAVTLGSAASYNGATPATLIKDGPRAGMAVFAQHEFGHTIQFIGISAIAGASGRGVESAWDQYVGLGVIGMIPVVGAPWENFATELGYFAW